MMRVYKPIILYLPKLLVKELHNYLSKHPPSFKFEITHFYYVIHYLTIKQIQNKKKEYFSLNSESMKSATISNIARYIRILKSGGFIISDGIYKPRVKSLGYKINQVFIKDIYGIKLVQESKLSKNLIKKSYKSKSHINRLEPHLKAMYNELMKLELDYQSAIKWTQTNANDVQKLCYLTSINHIEDKRFRYFKRNKTNRRLDTNLTNLKSDLKQFIKGDYVSIDLKNSQPFLLGVLINSIINNRDTLCCYLSNSNLIKAFGVKRIKDVLLIHQTSENIDMVKFRLFYNTVLKGSLYDDFINRYSGAITRREVKLLMFKVLFSRNEYIVGYKKVVPYNDDKKIFASVFPFVYETIKALKVKDHRTLPIYLQRLESHLFIDCIARKLVDNGIVPFTIHDSVIVKTKDQNKAIEIMNDVFIKEIGDIPTYDIKKLK
jgi:hypothetical protein